MVAQTESTPPPVYAKIKEWLAFASVIVVVAGGIAAGLLGGMKLVIAPLQTDIRAIHGRLDRMDNHIHGRIDQMDSHIQGRLDQMDGHIRGLDSRLGGLDSRVAGLDNRLRGLDNRLGALDSRVAGLDNRLGALDSRVAGLDSRLGGLDGRLRGFEQTTQNEFKAVRQDISALSERLTRVETLLEQVVRQPDTPQ